MGQGALKEAGAIVGGVITGVIVFLVLYEGGWMASLQVDGTFESPSSGTYTQSENLSGMATPVRTYFEALYRKQDFRTAYNQLETGLRKETDFEQWKQNLVTSRESSRSNGWRWYFLDSIHNATIIDHPDYERSGARVMATVRKVGLTEDVERGVVANHSTTRLATFLIVRGSEDEWYLTEVVDPFF